ncbi:hypothetical protein BSPWISOXPB_1087 [uncultured Gammaproteobacteria bacterium]|nr:hypothetical protein BSPWISOXPB_1087 [uncultured Gammaproteobacteria bacterium]
MGYNKWSNSHCRCYFQKIPGGKQLVDKISSIVDKKKKVRTSKVGDKVITPNDKDFTQLKNGNWKKQTYGRNLVKR